MRRVDPGIWSGAAMLAVLVIASAPSLLGLVPTRIPHPLWIAVFIVMVAATIATAVWSEEPRRGRPALALAALASWTLVLGAGGVGIVPVLLVTVVALAPAVVPVTAAAALIIVNLAVLAAAVLWARPPAQDAIVELVMLLLFYALIQTASLLGSIVLIREQRARRALAQAHVALSATSALLADAARTRERLRISRELHDLVGHQLTVLALELEAARHQADGEARERVERAGRLARELLDSVRSTVGELRVGDDDLRALLDRVVQDIRQPRIRLRIEGEIDLDEAGRTLLVRAVQEIITNTIRHARAEELVIDLVERADAIELRARDDGRGAREPRIGNGLRGLRERFAEVGGDVAVDGRDGFSVIARMPR